MKDFRDSMSGIFTTCVSFGTIDESPMAYKPPERILEAISGNATVLSHWRVRYNFKAAE
jgi:hypothetical protein